MYPLLKKLTEKGLLTAYDEPQGNRQKKYYQITQQGETAFSSWLCASIDFADSTDQQLAKIFFFDKLPIDERTQRLLEYEQDCTVFLHKLRAMLMQYEKTGCSYYKLSTLYYGINAVQETLKWCRHIKCQDNLLDFINEN